MTTATIEKRLSKTRTRRVLSESRMSQARIRPILMTKVDPLADLQREIAMYRAVPRGGADPRRG